MKTEIKAARRSNDRTTPMSARLPTGLYEEFKAAAAKQDMNVTKALTKAIKKFIKKANKPPMDKAEEALREVMAKTESEA